MPALENVFSWSKSRAEEFDECKRKYYYARYLSWGGWEAAAPAQVRLAYILKNLKNRWAWKGEVVHHVIETAMKSTEDIHHAMLSRLNSLPLIQIMTVRRTAGKFG